MAFIAVCCLLMSYVRPVYANVDPTWEEEVTVIPEQTPEETPPEETVPEAPETEPEPGFTTPGNGDLGDEIKNSSGKDFYTIHTKNNNTFYMVIDHSNNTENVYMLSLIDENDLEIDHSNNTENVYMLSLIDENDLEEFIEQTEKETETEPAPAVIIPETKPEPVETETPKQPETEAKEPDFVQAHCYLFSSTTLRSISRVMKKRMRTKVLKRGMGFQQNETINRRIRKT